jgi:hypothetical protein
MPAREPAQRWERLLDTADARWERRSLQEAPSYELAARAVAVFRLVDRSANGRPS